MIPSEKKAREIWVVRWFFRCRSEYALVGKLRPSDRPDLFATVRKRGERFEVGIEVTDIAADAKPGESSRVMAFTAFWRKMNRELQKIPMPSRLCDRDISIHFTEGPPLPSAELALQIVSFAADCKGNGKWSTDDFGSDYPLLREHVKSICLESHRSPTRWCCLNLATTSSSGMINLITDIILRKSQRSEQYAWRDCRERWLLLCVSARTNANVLPWPDDEQWTNRRLMEVCQQSVMDPCRFTHVFYFDMLEHRYREVWPSGKEGRCPHT